MKVTYYFSGYVKSSSYEIITDAMVEINTVEFNSGKKLKKTATTDKKGYFKIRIPTNARKPRFVLNIWKEGYGLFSQIFFRGKQNSIWLLTKGTIHTIDPTKDNTIRNTPLITKYTGPLSRHIDISKITSRRLLQADKIAVIKKLLKSTPSYLDSREITGIRNKGIQVTIKANTLVDSNGKPPVGSVNVTLATVDILGPDSFPGDFTAVFKDEEGNDQIGYMITYGAGSVDVLANGKRYQLKPGTKAKIEIPLPKHLEGSKSIPKTIPFLEYNKEEGIWEKIGEGTFNESTQVYTATATHFSSYNMDILKTDQACLVIDGTGIKKDYRLQVDFVYNGNNWTRSKYPNANEIYALYNLPPDILYTLTAFKTDLTNPLVIDSTTCTPTLQDSGPNKPDPDPNFTFPACHHSSSDPNPVPLSADRPDHPTDLIAEQIGCNYIDLLWVGTANGPEEGYIIKVYQNEVDPGLGNDPLFVYTASYEDVRFRVEGRERTDGTMEGLDPNTTYYIHIHQYDEYAQEDSEPWPNPPLAVTTLQSQTFSIINKICDQQITHVYFNDETEEQAIPPTGFDYNIRHDYSVCQRPDSIQVKTPLYSFDFRNNSLDLIYVTALVKILPGHDWKSNDIPSDDIPPQYLIRTLVFQDDGTFIYYDDAGGEIDRGTYQETNQNCTNGIIYFSMTFDNLGLVDCRYDFSTVP
ncbi:MAG: hypothetical protein ACFFG0_30120, partial [Candidatus Thorarchaeota archaeon]